MFDFYGRIKLFKTMSRRKLSENYIPCVTVILFTTFINYSFFDVYNTAITIVSDICRNTSLTMCKVILVVVMFFAAAPLNYGLMRWFFSAADCKNIPLGEIIEVYCLKDIMKRAYMLFITVAFCVAVGCAPVLSLFLFFDNVSYYIVIIPALWAIYNGVFCLFWVYYASKHQTKPLRECFYDSVKIFFSKSLDVFAFIISFIPIFIISLFSAGILFVFYTIPYILLSLGAYFSYLESIYCESAVDFETAAMNQTI